MNRLIIVFCVLCISGCQVLGIKKKISNKQIKEVTIYANTITEFASLKPIKLKAKINVFKDSIVISASHMIGIEVANLVITNQKIYIDQKIQNKKDSLTISELDPRFRLKGIKKSIKRPKGNKDTLIYQIPKINCLFTNYTETHNLFLPQKIFFSLTSDTNSKIDEGQISLNYKSINFPSKKKERK